MTFHQTCINLFPLTLSGKEGLCPFYPRSNRGLVFVTKPSRKQNLFFQNKFIFSIRFVTVLNEKTFSRIIVVFVFHYLSTNLWCLVFVELSIVVSWCDDWRSVVVWWLTLGICYLFFHVSSMFLLLLTTYIWYIF